MTKNEMITTLKNQGHDPNALINLKKDELSRMLLTKPEQDTEIDIDIESAVEQEDSIVLKETVATEGVEETVPSVTDPEWTNYVLKQFVADELEGLSNPRVEGLRRVSEKLVGEIIEERCDVLFEPNMENGFRAICKASVLFENAMGVAKRFEAVADAYDGNLTPEFASYLVTMAETRAKGRCFRNALKLRRVVSAEEMKSVNAPEVSYANEKIDGGQISAIRMMSERLSISIGKLLKHMEIKEENIMNLTKIDGIIIVKTLNTYKEHGGIPSSVLVSNS